jgi:hypothetical protein
MNYNVLSVEENKHINIDAIIIRNNISEHMNAAGL